MGDRLKFYTDEHVSPAVVTGLRQRGVDVLTTQEANKLGESDNDQLLFAGQNERVLITQDADFLRLHTRGVKHSGIVYASQRLPIGAIVQGLALIYQVLDSDDLDNHIEFI